MEILLSSFGRLLLLHNLTITLNLTDISENQQSRANNVIAGTKFEQYQQVRRDIQDFKKVANVDTIIVLWTANTERFSSIEKGLNETFAELEAALLADKAEISPSTIFAMASIAEQCTYINGSPQNTFVPAIVEYAESKGVFIAGDDFKSGQTKLKSVLVDFLVGAGIKPVSIVSYNHLGNNDGKNLSSPLQFRSKEVSYEQYAVLSVELPGKPNFVKYAFKFNKNNPFRLQRAMLSTTWSSRIKYFMKIMNIRIMLWSSSMCHMWATAREPWTNTRARY